MKKYEILIDKLRSQINLSASEYPGYAQEMNDTVTQLEKAIKESINELNHVDKDN